MSGARPRILLTRTLQDFAVRELEKKFDVTVHKRGFPIPRSTLIRKIRDVEGLICMPYDTIDRRVMDASSGLRAISTYSVGYDHIDIEHAKKRGIAVGFTPDVLTETTANLAFALMLDVMRRVTEGDRLIRSGGWSEVFGADSYIGTEVFGKTVGILGMGRIGRSFAKKAAVFGMNILYHNRNRLGRAEEGRLGTRYASLDRLFSKSDVITVHVPHTRETDGMIGSGLLGRMKGSSFLVNTSRGRIINEGDLVLALKRGRISGAALDVFCKEPVGRNNPLAGLENVVLAPHIGSSTAETRTRMAELAVLNLKLAMANKRPRHPVEF